MGNKFQLTFGASADKLRAITRNGGWAAYATVVVVDDSLDYTTGEAMADLRAELSTMIRQHASAFSSHTVAVAVNMQAQEWRALMVGDLGDGMRLLAVDDGYVLAKYDYSGPEETGFEIVTDEALYAYLCTSEDDIAGSLPWLYFDV